METIKLSKKRVRGGEWVSILKTGLFMSASLTKLVPIDAKYYYITLTAGADGMPATAEVFCVTNEEDLPKDTLTGNLYRQYGRTNIRVTSTHVARQITMICDTYERVFEWGQSPKYSATYDGERRCVVFDLRDEVVDD